MLPIQLVPLLMLDFSSFLCGCYWLQGTDKNMHPRILFLSA